MWSFFADDKRLGWILKRPRELAQALDQFGKFLCLLRSFGLQASPTKSKAILAMRESTSHSLRKLWVSTFKGQTWLRIPVGVVNEYLPSLTVCTQPEPQGLDPQGLFDRIDK